MFEQEMPLFQLKLFLLLTKTSLIQDVTIFALPCYNLSQKLIP